MPPSSTTPTCIPDDFAFSIRYKHPTILLTRTGKMGKIRIIGMYRQ